MESKGKEGEPAMTTIGRPLALLAATMMTAGLLAACDDDQSKQAREKELEDYAARHGVVADVKVNQDGAVETVTIERNIGGIKSQAGKDLQVPADFPGDVPLYPGLQVHAANTMPQGHMIQGNTADDPETVAAAVTAGMTAQGWTADQSQRSGPMISLTFKKDNRTTGVTLLPGATGTTVQVTTLTLG
jgi:hypothetical protein